VKREYWRYLPTIFPYVRRHKVLAAVSVICTLVSTVISLLEPWPLALLIDGILSNQRPPHFLTAVAGTSKSHLILAAVFAGFILTLLGQAVGVLGEYVNTKLDQRISLEFRSDLFSHCQRLSQAFHDHTTSGDFMYRINFEAKTAGELSVALPPLAQSMLTLVGMFVVALRIDWILALLSLVVVPFVYYSIEFYGNRIEPRLIQVRNLEARSMTMVNDAMAMLRIVTAFNRQDHEHGLFREQGVQAMNARVRLTVAQTLFSVVVSVMSAAGIALVLGFGAHAVVSGRLTVGQLLVILSYIRSIYQPLETISGTMAQLQQQLIAIRYAKQLLDTEPEIADRPGARDLHRIRGTIHFEGVGFQYRGRPPALSDVSFEARAGEVIAVVGPTGAGKSTLVSLIPRFLEPTAGRVTLDGTDLRDISLQCLREQIGFVQQEPLLFSRSIAENIRYGRLDATEEEVIAAAKDANAHDFIMNLPQQYDTPLGERGARISGGERQRIAIARAFLKDAPVLVLDEPTSSIDSKTEKVILDALDRLMEGRTTFVVSHRLSTIRSADRILVVNDGRIVEQGQHGELLRSGGLYCLLHSLQAGERRKPTAPASGPPAVSPNGCAPFVSAAQMEKSPTPAPSNGQNRAVDAERVGSVGK
jgi:ATP-binding cassette, subfamily B, bacterial